MSSPAVQTRLRPSPVSPGARLLGIGSAVPSRVVSAADLGAPFGKPAEWIEARTGIRELRRLHPGEDLTPLALAGATDALRDAGVDGASVDMVIAASCSRPAPSPSLAGLIAHRLAPHAAPLDLNAACSGFCYALAGADALIRSGAARTVLVVAAEQMSALLDPDDLGTSIIFGDGAGAAVLGTAPDGTVHIGPVVWGSDGEQAALIEIPGEKQAMRMRGQHVFRWAVDEMHRVAAQACVRAGITLGDVEVFVPHQANLRIIDAMVRKLGLQHASVATDVVRSGNTSAASIPLALRRLADTGSLRSGQLTLTIGFGAGLSYAAQVLRAP